jgi:Na+-driven multidrug efflux pump
MYFCGLLISPLCNGLGKEALASRSVANQLYDLCATIYQNSTKACTTYIAQSAGKKEYKNVSKGLRVGFLQSTAFVTPFILAIAIFYKPVCSAFLNESSAEITRAYAYEFARYWLPVVYFNLVNNLFHGLFRATKATGIYLARRCSLLSSARCSPSCSSRTWVCVVSSWAGLCLG